MAIKRTYIQQLYFDGTTYTKGSVIDLLSRFNIACKDFPFKKNPEAKDLPTRDWAGTDGRDVYIPKVIPMKNYDIDVEFVYKGSESTIHNDVSDFIDFIYGRNTDAVGGRLAVFDEYVAMGRKDVHVVAVDNDVYDCDDSDPDAIVSFKIKFSVEDPTTDIQLVTNKSEDGTITVTDLYFPVV